MENPVYALHVSQNSDGYERVKVLANRINQNNYLAAIAKNGEVYYTGGHLFPDTDEIRELFDSKPKSEHYAFATLLKTTPFAKAYYED